MYPTDVYLEKLRTLLQEYPETHCVPHMLEIINNANVNKLTTMQLNLQLFKALNDKETLWPRVKHSLNKKSKQRSEERKNILKAALEAVMREVILFSKPPSPRSPRGDLPPTPDKFTRALYQAQLSVWYTPEKTEIDRKINNSIERLRKVFLRHQEALNKQNLEPHVKRFHQRRVEIIMNWLENNNIHVLIELIKSLHSETKKSELPLSYNASDSIEDTQCKQDLLHWLGIILENPAASESPYAMSEILDLLQLPEEQVQEAAIVFSETYVIENAHAWINIDHEARNKFLSKLSDGKPEEIKGALIDIYNTLHHLVQGTDQITSELRKLEDELDLEHPSNRSHRESSKSSVLQVESGSSKESDSYKDSVSSSSMILSTPSRRSSHIISAESSPSLTAARLDESSGSSKSKLTQ